MKARPILGALLLACLRAAPAAAQEAGARSEVFVLATLYRRHAETPAYGHDTLRAVIERVRPEVVVLDVSPSELREQAVHPSKAEYPNVIFPLVRRHGWQAYAGEPDEPEFGEIVGRLGRRLAAFRAEQPALSRADEEYADAAFAALAGIWRTPADVNGAVTDALLAARRRWQDRAAGPEVADAWRRWNDHAAAVVLRAARENPGRRILVLIGVENAALLRPALRNLPELRVIDVEAWLRRPATPSTEGLDR
jgi:hypothetical protein